MKKKLLSILAMVLILVMIPSFAFAAKSKEYDDDDYISGDVSGGGSGSGSGSGSGIYVPGAPGMPIIPPGATVVPGTVSDPVHCPPLTGPAGTCLHHADVEVRTLADGTMLSTTGATRDHSFTFYRLGVNMPLPNGTMITTKNDGCVDIGNVKIHFASDIAEIAGLYEHIQKNIIDLNAGKDMTEIFGDTLGVDLTGWKRVGNTRAVILTDQTTGLTNTGTEFYLDISPIDVNGTFAFIYYDNHTGRWNWMPTSIDPTTGLFKIYLPGSCTIQLLQKVL